MKKTRILLTFLFIFSSISAIGLSSVLNFTVQQPIKTQVDSSEKNRYALEAKNKPNITEIDLEELAAMRNARLVQSKQISRGSTPQKELIGKFRLTFYTPSPNETDNSPFITATGARTKPGITVAVDPRYWEMGTQFYIEGYGYVIAEDTGSKIKGPHSMDVCVETKDEAFKNGIQYRNVWVVKA